MQAIFRRICGLSSIFAGLILILAHILNLGGVKDFGTVLGNTLVLTAHLLLVFAFFGLYEAQGDKSGILGLLGMIAGIIGTILVTAIVYVEIAGASGTQVDSIFASGVPSSIHSFGPLLFVAGMILFGISIIREKNLPLVGGYFLIIGTLIFSAGSFAGVAQGIVSVIGAAFTGGGFVWLGLPMAKHKY